MQVLIFENQIMGISSGVQDLLTLTIGYSIAEYAGDVPIESLYFVNGSLELIPPSPDGDYQWNGVAWVEIPRLPDWSGLASDLRGSEVWAKSYVAASTTLAGNTAWTLLCSTLTGISRSVPDLMFAIGALRVAMAATEDGDFTEAQVDAINAIMADRGFPSI